MGIDLQSQPYSLADESFPEYFHPFEGWIES